MWALPSFPGMLIESVPVVEVLATRVFNQIRLLYTYLCIAGVFTHITTLRYSNIVRRLLWYGIVSFMYMKSTDRTKVRSKVCAGHDCPNLKEGYACA